MTDAQVVVMFAIWELTKNDVVLAVAPDQIGAHINRHAGYVRSVIKQLMLSPYQKLQPVPYHQKPQGRLRKAYRIHDQAVNLEETAMILCRLRNFALDNPKNNRIERELFSQYIASEFRMKRPDIDARINDALRYNYLESPLSGYIKGTQRLVDEVGYLGKLASLYRSSTLSKKKNLH